MYTVYENKEMTELQLFVRSFTSLSAESWDILASIATKIELKKRDYLVEAGKICHSLYLISKGYCRGFLVQDGVEVNTTFYLENEIATNINSYITRERSSFAIQACEPVVAYCFHKSEVLEAGRLSPQLNMAGKRCLQLIAAKQEKQLEMFRLLTAKKRYEYLEQYEPALLRRVSLTQLASYIGVARETLSRIRKKRTGK
jgi:CRP-like cAMP-binding protein